MGIFDKARSGIKKVKDQLMASAVGSIEIYDGKDEILEGIFDLYEHAGKNIEVLSREWQDNRKAYYRGSKDFFGGLATIGMNDGEPATYCSSIVQDKIDDLAAMQLQGNPRVFPLPEVEPEAVMATPDGMTPQVFVRKGWELCFEDLCETNSIDTLYYMIAKDSRLCGIAVTKQYTVLNQETGEIDIKIDIVQPENIRVDPAATSFKDALYVFQDSYVSAVDLVAEYPQYADEIASNIIGKSKATDKGTGPATIKTGGTTRESRDFKGMVLVCEGYFRDDTIEVETIQSEDPEMPPERTERLKYPTGRRITFLPDAKVTLDDDKNPYSTFPFAKFCANPVSWSFYGKADATPMRELQIYDDKVFQQAFANFKQAGNCKILGSASVLESLDNSIGQKIPTDHVGGVKVYMPTGLLGDALALHQTIRGEADRISGVYAPTEGRPSSVASSGRAIGLLQESGNRKLGPSKNSFADYLLDTWTQVSDLMMDAYKKGRKLRSSDDDMFPSELPFDLIEVTKSIITRVASNTQFPSDPVSRFNMMMQLMQTKAEDGLPLADRQAVLEHLNFPGAADIIRRLAAKVTNQTVQGPQGVQGMRNLEQNMATQAAGAKPQNAPPPGPPQMDQGAMMEQLLGGFSR